MSNESMLSPAHAPLMAPECAGPVLTDIMQIKDMVQQCAKLLGATRAEVAMLRERLVGQRPMMPTAAVPPCLPDSSVKPERGVLGDMEDELKDMLADFARLEATMRDLKTIV